MRSKVQKEINESNKVFDEDEMRDEFENKLEELLKK